MDSRSKCDISGTATCSTVAHRQIRELKSRWQMRWAALDVAIEAEHNRREALQKILEHIVCKAKSSGKSRKSQNPDWMENPISTVLIRAFLRAIWPDPESVDQLSCEVLALDAYYGHKLLCLPSVEEDFNLDSERTDGNMLYPIQQTSAGIPPELSSDIVETPNVGDVFFSKKSKHASEPVMNITAIPDNESISSVSVLESTPSWYELPPSIRHDLNEYYPWTSNTLSDGSINRPRNVMGLYDTSEASSSGHSYFPDYMSALPSLYIGTTVAGDYTIRAILRAERNYVVYSAAAMFSGHRNYTLTAIRSPQDCTSATYRKQPEYSDGVEYADGGGVVKMDDIKKKKKEKKGTLFNKPQSDLKKAADSQRKYIIKLIKKRQASVTYLDTFLFDGMIWIVQSQIPHDNEKQPVVHKLQSNQVDTPRQRGPSSQQKELDGTYLVKQPSAVAAVDANNTEQSDVAKDRSKLSETFIEQLRLMVEDMHTKILAEQDAPAKTTYRHTV